MVALFWAVILVRRRRRRQGLDGVSPRDYPSRIGRRKRFNFNFNFKFPTISPLPFSFASPLSRFDQPAIRQRQASSVSGSAYVSNNRIARSDPFPKDTAQAASSIKSGKNDGAPEDIMDEKRQDLRPVQQANIRKSGVSWLKRSSIHSPLCRKSSRASMATALTGANTWSRSGSTASTIRDDTGYFSTSGEAVVEEGSRSGSGNKGTEEVPPMRNLGSQRIMIYTEDTTPTPMTSAGEPVTVTTPPRAFTKEDARAYYRSIWAESSAAGTTERLSAMSTSTDMTSRTSMLGVSGHRESMEQAGLSPPPGYVNMYRNIQIPVATATGIVKTTGNTGIQMR